MPSSSRTAPTRSWWRWRTPADEIPAKPRSGWKVKGWADQVQTLRDFSNSMLDGTLRAADVRAGLEKSPELRQVYGRAQLYEAVGHDRSLRGVSLRSGSYGLFNGEKFDIPRTIWTVERKAASGFGNWPDIMGHGATPAAAIEAFKRASAEQARLPRPSARSGSTSTRGRACRASTSARRWGACMSTCSASTM